MKMFDSGQVDIYKLSNTAQAGDVPKEGLTYSSSYWYEERAVGVTRFYAALKADVKIERLIRIWQDRDVYTDQVCKIDDAQYKIVQVQHGVNEDGLDITDLSLERLGEAYGFI